MAPNGQGEEKGCGFRAHPEHPLPKDKGAGFPAGLWPWLPLRAEAAER